MVNIVLVLASRVGMNGLMHVHTLAWIVRPCLFHIPNEGMYQYADLTPSLWRICTCILALC